MPPDECRSEGTPSLSEGPYVRGETFGYFGAFAKVTRRKGGTLGGRYRRNGYVHLQNHHREQARSYRGFASPPVN